MWGKILKKLQIALTLSLVAVVLFCGGIVSALNTEDASALAFFSNDTPHLGETVAFRVEFNVSSSASQVQIKTVGIHFDWMDQDVFAGKTLTTPQSVTSDLSYLSDPIFTQIPLNVTAGTHSYFIGVDGTDASGDFSWDSPAQSIPVTYSNGQTPVPTATPNPTGDGQAEGPPNFLTILVVVAVVAIVIAVAVIVMEVRKKPKQVNPVAEKANPVVEQPQKDNYDI